MSKTEILEEIRKLTSEERHEIRLELAALDGGGNGQRKEVDLRALGISREQAADLRTRLATFEDWNDPEMEIYDDYDQALATLKQNS